MTAVMPWQPIYTPPTPRPIDEYTQAEWSAFRAAYVRCRDCGTRNKLNAGGSQGPGGFDLCDDCVAIDGCRPWPEHDGWHATHWGTTHHGSEHAALVEARERRRAAYRRAHPAEQQDALPLIDFTPTKTGNPR